MGKASRRQMAAGERPVGNVVRFEELEYKTLRLHIRDTDAALAAAQAEVNKVAAERDAYIALLAAKYGFDPKSTRWQWNDATSSFSFS